MYMYMYMYARAVGLVWRTVRTAEFAPVSKVNFTFESQFVSTPKCGFESEIHVEQIHVQNQSSFSKRRD